MRILLALCAMVVWSQLMMAAEAELKRRPEEILHGRRPLPQGVIWQEARDGLSGWKVTGKGTLESGDGFRLWNDTAAKVVFQGPGRVAVQPAGLVIEKPVAGVAFWVICPPGGKTANTLRIKDAQGKTYKMTTRNNASFWARQPWWCTSSFLMPAKAVFPVTITELAFEAGEKIKAGEALYFDCIHTFDIKAVDYPPEILGEPDYLTTPDTILPTVPSGQFTNAVTRDGGRYVFSYQGADGQLQYIYQPLTGTLGDFSVVADGRPAFMPMAQGGPIAHQDGTVFKPAGEKLATVTAQELQDQTLKVSWKWEAAGRVFAFTYRFTIKGRSLVVTADCEEPVVTAFDCGYVDGLEKPRLFGLTYLNYRWDYPRLLVNDDCFVSLFSDWYTGNSTQVVDGSGYGELPGAKVLGDRSARILGGLIYKNANRGERAKLHERLFLTVSPKLEDVLPNNPNPKSRYFDKMARLVCHTRMYPVVEPKHAAMEINYAKRLRDYGVTDIFYRTHYNEFRTPIRSNNFTFSLQSNLEAGGEEVMKTFYEEIKKVFPVVGPYQDNRVIHPLSEYFNYDFLAQWYDDTIMSGWDNAYQINPPAQRLLFAQFTPKFVAKFGWNGCYLDETTNTPPWGLVDFNRLTPGAAMSRSVLLHYGKLLQEVREYYGGPIWSEGNADFFWTGCVDTDYAQCNKPDDYPLPDYKLRKMNPLECLNGYDLQKNLAGVDYLVSAQIVNGNIGHLWGGSSNTILGDCGKYKPETYRSLCKSYFMMRQLQELYAGVPVEEIRYQCGDALVTATEMLRKNLPNEGKVYERYANGLEIWVNRHAEASWEVTVDGEEMTLPPYGYAACLPGEIMEYSALKDGHRVDYVKGPLYTYMDGRGEVTEFPELKAAHAYVFHKTPQGTTLTPVPFLAEESLGGLSAAAMTPLAQNGTPEGPRVSLEVIDEGKARFTTSAKVFRYLLEH